LLITMVHIIIIDVNQYYRTIFLTDKWSHSSDSPKFLHKL
jgi:hypothetical protein